MRANDRSIHAFLKALLVLVALALTACAGSSNPSSATLMLPLVTHAAFFSKETHQKIPLDPQVFVRDSGTPAAVGPQNISHVAGYRNALLSDPPGLPIYAADGKPLDMTLGEWLGATGEVALTPLAGGMERVTVTATGLKPSGVYTLFENHFDQQPVGFTPLDGTGRTNVFRADAAGRAQATVTAPKTLTHANAVLVVYQSDGATHGMSRGTIGADAHHQLIARIP